MSLHNSKETKAILNAADDLGYGTEWLRGENTTIDIRDGRVRLDPDPDIVVNRLLLSKEEEPAEALGLAATLSRLRPTLNTPTATMTALHKFATGVALADAGLPVPDALLALSGERLNRDRERFGAEAVYKTAIGTHGGGTWKVGTDEQVNPTAGFKGLFEATGSSPAPYIARLAVERAGGEVDPERVVELSATLDDSVPACKPRIETASPPKSGPAPSRTS